MVIFFYNFIFIIKNVIILNMKQTMNEKIILFRGHFDPPTIAHLDIMNYIIMHFPNKKLVLLPYITKNDMVNKKEKIKLLKILTNDIKKDVKINKYELNKKNDLYFVLKHFKNPYLIIGADELEGLLNIKRSKTTLKENRFIVFPRNGYDIKKILKK